MEIPNFSRMRLADWAGLDFSCDCGRRHSVGIECLDISEGASAAAAECAVLGSRRSGAKGRVLVVGDRHTLEVAGKALAARISDLGGGSVEASILELPVIHGDDLVPDESAVGRILIECGGASFILAAGSGSVNDACRLVSARTGIPYAVFATAPSMDGYASTVSPLIVGGKKITYEAVYPRGIFGDPKILASAPPHMIRAGFGDILGKFTALADWRLARELTGEYHCARIEALVERAIERCSAPVTAGRGVDPQAVTDALVLSGLAMGMAGNSRPASGAEHHMAHFWETTALAAGRTHPLHGNSVGAATLAVAELYSLLGSSVPPGVNPPDPKLIRELLAGAGYGKEASPVRGDRLGPAGLGIGREAFYEGVLHAMEIRERFTVLRLADSLGALGPAAEELTARFYW